MLLLLPLLVCFIYLLLLLLFFAFCCCCCVLLHFHVPVCLSAYLRLPLFVPVPACPLPTRLPLACTTQSMANVRLTLVPLRTVPYVKQQQSTSLVNVLYVQSKVCLRHNHLQIVLYEV